jgi:hypothetical protein
VAFALAGGTPMKSSLTVLAEMTGVDMSPKGGAVAFTTVERRFEVWTLSNVLPSKPSTR